MAPAAAAAPAEEGEEGEFWFWVKYGQDQQELFNSDCWANVLRDYIKERCGYADIPEEVDLQREDGTRVELGSLGRTNASGSIPAKGSCYLVKLVPHPEDDAAAPTAELLYEPPEGGEVPSAPDPKGKKK